MKILIISPLFYPEAGGSQQYMEEIYSQMVKNHKDVSVDVLCYNTKHTYPKEVYRGLNITRIQGFSILPGQFAIPDPFQLLSFLITQGSSYDLIHCSTRFFDSSWWAPIFAKIASKKIILTDHCADFPMHKNPLISFVAKVVDLSVDNFFLNFFNKIFVTNFATQNFFKKTFNKNPKVIYGGVDYSVFKPQARSANERLQILFVGRMIESKGVRILFDIAKNINQVDFIFAGPGDLVENLKQELKDKNLEHIKILGGIKREEVAKLMQESDILVHPSYHHEGFPNVLTEAGGSKLTVLATDVGGTGEIIINNDTGLLVESKNPQALKEALVKLIEDKSLREKLAEGLYKHVRENFDWESSSEKLYKEIIYL